MLVYRSASLLQANKKSFIGHDIDIENNKNNIQSIKSIQKDENNFPQQNCCRSYPLPYTPIFVEGILANFRHHFRGVDSCDPIKVASLDVPLDGHHGSIGKSPVYLPKMDGENNGKPY